MSSSSTQTPNNVAQFLLSWRFLRVATAAYLITVALLWLVLIVMWVGGKNGRDAQGDVLGADFPAFYTGATLLRNGEAEKLYDPVRQRQLQQQFMPGMKGLSFFINPPPYALWLKPLAALTYPHAFAIWTCLSLGCFIASILLLRPILPILQIRIGGVLMALALGFAPVYYTLSAGQNTGFTLLLHTAILLALVRRADFTAGLIIAIGLIKPQLFLPIIPLLLLARRSRALGGFAIGTVFMGCITFFFCGPNTAGDWWRGVMSPFYQAETAKQVDVMYSWPSFWELLLGHNAISTLLGYACALIIFGALCWWWKDAARNADSDIAVLYGLTIAGTILLSPHLCVYDLALLLVPGLVLVDRVLNVDSHQLVALRFGIIALYLSALFIDQVKWTHLQFLVPLLTFVFIASAPLLLRNRQSFELADVAAPTGDQDHR